MLKLFALNQMPEDLESLIVDFTNELYYEAVTAYINGKYHIKAKSLEVMREVTLLSSFYPKAFSPLTLCSVTH